jgi:hypothetical protein
VAASSSEPQEVEPLDRTDEPVEPEAALLAPTAAAVAAEPVGDLTLSQFESVWPALVAGVRDDLGPRRQALFREASPGSVQGATVTLHLPDHLSFHLEQLQGDDLVREVVEARAAELLGGSIRVEFRSGGGRSAATSSSDAEAETPPDKHRLLEAPSGTTDPDALVEGLLGGQVIEEIVDDD